MKLTMSFYFPIPREIATAIVLLATVGFSCSKVKLPTATVADPVEIPLVELPAGELMMGSHVAEEGRSDDETLHLVKISRPFWIGRTEVTQRQWFDVMGTTIRQQRDKAQRLYAPAIPLGKRIKQFTKDIFCDSNMGAWAAIKRVAIGNQTLPLSGEGDDYPMYYVSYDDAMKFCRQLTERGRAVKRVPAGYEYRLPTEAEWEYACRAGSATRFANGDTEDDLEGIGWYQANSEGTSHPVGLKMPNVWGLYDMHGNVQEWCHDQYDDYQLGDVTDPVGPEEGFYRVARGGRWNAIAAICRSASRVYWHPLDAYCYLGFRVVLAPLRSGGDGNDE